jgi:multicomponent Na+:H+ antiporter subunit D
MFFGQDKGIRAHEPPSNMLVAMGIGAAACVLIGVFPGLLYEHLPFEVDYAPYTVRHVIATLGLLSFTALGFFALLSHLDPEPTISLDTDWFYRRGLSTVAWYAFQVLMVGERILGRAYEAFLRRPLLGAAAIFAAMDATLVDRAMVGIGNVTDRASQRLRPAVTGHAQFYGITMAVGVLIAIAIAVFAR